MAATISGAPSGPAALRPPRARRDASADAEQPVDHRLPDDQRNDRLRGALDAARLRCQSAHMNFARLDRDAPAAFAEAKALGAGWVACPWVDPGKPWTRDDALKTAAAFNRFGKAAQAADLRFAYHCHGYEFVPSPEGTLFDTLAQQTDPAAVTFQMDVFHALLGGADPVALIARYGNRVSSLHLKDLKRGFPVKMGTATGATPRRRPHPASREIKRERRPT